MLRAVETQLANFTYINYAQKGCAMPANMRNDLKATNQQKALNRQTGGRA